MESFGDSSGMTSIDTWYRHVVLGGECSEQIRTLLRTEIPPMLSWITRGGCAVQCQHCIFPTEGPRSIAKQIDSETILVLLRQMPAGAQLIHEGRQLLPWQIPALKSIADAGFGISIINNGQYASSGMLRQIENVGLRIDTLDISVDGIPDIHNKQRSNAHAWTWAMNGLMDARRILNPSGKLTSLYTLTRLNCSCVREAGELLIPLVDEWHLTTMSLRPGVEHLRATKGDLAIALEKLFEKQWKKPVFLRSYSLEDFMSMLEIIGTETARKALIEAQVTYNAIVLTVHGLPLYFFPKSLWSNETTVIDADGWWRLPYSVAYTLNELQAGTDKTGKDISHFSIAEVSGVFDLRARFAETADTWWQVIGQRLLALEREAIQKFFNTERR